MTSWPIFTEYQKVAVADTQLDTDTSSIITILPHEDDNVKGDWAEQYSSTPFDAHAILLRPISYGQTEFIFDICTGGSAAEVIILSNILWSGLTSNKYRHPYDYFFPLYIPEGSRLSMRQQCNDFGGNDPLGVQIMIFGGTAATQSYQKAYTIGVDTSDTGGTAVDPGATANTKGDWYEIGRVSEELAGFIVVLGNSDNWREAYWLMDLAIGEEGEESILIPNYSFGAEQWTYRIDPMVSPFLPITLPAGGRISARAQCDITDLADRQFDLVIYGVG